MRSKQVILYISSILIYLLCVYLLNRHTKKKKIVYAISFIGITVFTCLKFIGKFKQIDFFFSKIFINSYFIILCIILYIPILIGSYMYTKYYIDKKNIIKPKSYIINFLLIFFIIISAYLLYSFWFIIYVYLF